MNNPALKQAVAEATTSAMRIALLDKIETDSFEATATNSKSKHNTIIAWRRGYIKGMMVFDFDGDDLTLSSIITPPRSISSRSHTKVDAYLFLKELNQKWTAQQ